LSGSSILPGAITNSDLLTAKGIPKEGLQKIKHYRGVTQGVWRFFVDTYGGGPEILSDTLNIYDSDIKQG
jgi:hypothetical protein